MILMANYTRSRTTNSGEWAEGTFLLCTLNNSKRRPIRNHAHKMYSGECCQLLLKKSARTEISG